MPRLSWLLLAGQAFYCYLKQLVHLIGLLIIMYLLDDKPSQARAGLHAQEPSQGHRAGPAMLSLGCGSYRRGPEYLLRLPH